MKKAFKCLLPLFLILLIICGCTNIKSSEDPVSEDPETTVSEGPENPVDDSAEKTVNIILKKGYWQFESELIVASVDESFQKKIYLVPKEQTNRKLSYTLTLPKDTERLYVRPPTALIYRQRIDPVSVTLQKSAPVMFTVDGKDWISAECMKGRDGFGFVRIYVMPGSRYISVHDRIRLDLPDGTTTYSVRIWGENTSNMEGKTANLQFVHLPYDFDYDGCTLTFRDVTERIKTEPQSDDIELIIMP